MTGVGQPWFDIYAPYLSLILNRGRTEQNRRGKKGGGVEGRVEGEVRVTNKGRIPQVI